MDWLRIKRSLLLLVTGCALAGIPMSSVVGGVSLSYWGQIDEAGQPLGGDDLNQLFAIQNFPLNPDFSEFISAIPGIPGETFDATTGYLEFPQSGVGQSNYGAVMRSVFIAPTSGNYEFYLKSTGEAALYISESAFPLTNLKRTVRIEPDAYAFGEDQFKIGITSTSPMFLNAGEGRFFTVAWKVGQIQGDLAIGMKVNDQPIQPIHLGNLQRHSGLTQPTNNSMTLYGMGSNGFSDSSIVEVNEGETVSIFAELDLNISNSNDIPGIQWRMDGRLIRDQAGTWLQIKPTLPAGRPFIEREVKIVVNGIGSQSILVIVNEDLSPPEIVRVYGSGWPHGIAIEFNEAIDPDSVSNPENYQIVGQDVEISKVEMINEKTLILKVSQYSGVPLRVNVQGVTDIASARNKMLPANREVELSDSLLAYWSFNDVDSREYVEDRANGHSGVLMGAQYTDDSQGLSGVPGDYAMDFGPDPGRQHIEISDATFLNESVIGDEMSVSFWQINSSIHNSSSYWMLSGVSTGGNRGNQAHVPWSNGQIYFDTMGCCDSGLHRINKPIQSHPQFNEDFFLAWHHYVFVKNGSQKQIWIDGQLFHESENLAPLRPGFTSMTIGSSRNGGNSLGGLIDDFAIFKASLTREEIRLLARNEAKPDTLIKQVNQPLAIVKDLSQVLFTEKEDFQVTFEVEGGERFTYQYQWFLNDKELPGEHESSLHFTSPELSLVGATLYAVAYNIDGTYKPVYSKKITIQKGAEIPPAELVSAIPGPVNNQLILRFSQSVSSEDVHRLNFSILTPNTNSNRTIRVLNAEYGSDESTIILDTSTMEPSTDYQVVAKRIRNQSSTTVELLDQKLGFRSLSRREGFVTALLYPEVPGFSLTPHFPENRRGKGKPVVGWAPFRGHSNWSNIRDGFSSYISYVESPNSGSISSIQTDANDNYAQMIFGWIHPPETGRYIFAIAVDDNAELYLSSDDNPARSQLIASEPEWNLSREFNDGIHDNNWSKPIDLKKGRDYYFEFLTKEDAQTDNASLAWTWSTDGSRPTPPAHLALPISGEFISTLMPVYSPIEEVSIYPEVKSHLQSDDNILIQLKDGQLETIDPQSIRVFANGTAISAAISKSDDLTNISIPANLIQAFPESEVHIDIEYRDMLGHTYSRQYIFLAPGRLPTNATKPRSEGLVSYWNFEDGFEDQSFLIQGATGSVLDHGIPGRGTSIRSSGGAFLQGKYLFLNGHDRHGFLEIPVSDETTNNHRGDLTISAWFQSRGFTKENQTLISHTGVSPYILRRNGDGSSLTSNYESSQITNPNNIDDRSWHHVALVCEDNAASNLYVDGRLIETLNLPHPPIGESPKLYLGGDPQMSPNQTWFGGLDEVSIWHRALNPSEILYLASGFPLLSLKKPDSPPSHELKWLKKDGSIEIHFEGILLRSTSIGGPWFPVPNAQSPYESGFDEDSSFFRVINE